MLVYTFKTYPDKITLTKFFPNIVVFHNNKDDTSDFCNKILKERPKAILGIANINWWYSRFEAVAINRFHKRSKVLKDVLIDKLDLFIPDTKDSKFTVNYKPDDSHCNYTMFRIQHFLNKNNLQIPFMFIHLRKSKNNIILLKQFMNEFEKKQL